MIFIDRSKLKIKIMGVIRGRPSQREGAEAIIGLVEEECTTGKDRMLANCQMNTLNTIFRGAGMDLHQAISTLQLDDEKYAVIADQEGLPWIAEEIRRVIDEAQSHAA